MDKIRVRDVELAYQWHGAARGRPFVLVHGFTGSSDDWADHVDELAQLGPTLLIDLRGHGASQHLGVEAAYTLDAIAADLEALFDALGIERCDLLGHSMGGMAALRFALQNPRRLHSLLLMDTSDSAIRMGSTDELAAMAKIVKAGGTEAMLRISRRAQRADAYHRYAERVGVERAQARIDAKLTQMDPAAFVGFARALGEQKSVRDRLGELQCPTLVMVGEQDLPFLSPAEQMTALIADAEKVAIPNAAHSPQLENPELWFDAIRRHLERVRA